MKLKLYVWHEVLRDWSDGIMFALAHDVEEARNLLRQKCHYIPDEDLDKEPEVYDSPYADLCWGSS